MNITPYTVTSCTLLILLVGLIALLVVLVKAYLELYLQTLHNRNK